MISLSTHAKAYAYTFISLEYIIIINKMSAQHIPVNTVDLVILCW